MTPDPLPPENASPDELRAYFRAVADAAMAAVVAGPPLPSRKGKHLADESLDGEGETR